ARNCSRSSPMARCRDSSLLMISFMPSASRAAYLPVCSGTSPQSGRDNTTTDEPGGRTNAGCKQHRRFQRRSKARPREAGWTRKESCRSPTPVAVPIERQDSAAFPVTIHHAMAKKLLQLVNRQVGDQNRRAHRLVTLVQHLKHQQLFMLAAHLDPHLSNDQQVWITQTVAYLLLGALAVLAVGFLDRPQHRGHRDEQDRRKMFLHHMRCDRAGKVGFASARASRQNQRRASRPFLRPRLGVRLAHAKGQLLPAPASPVAVER